MSTPLLCKYRTYILWHVFEVYCIKCTFFVLQCFKFERFIIKGSNHLHNTPRFKRCPFIFNRHKHEPERVRHLTRAFKRTGHQMNYYKYATCKSHWTVTLQVPVHGLTQVELCGRDTNSYLCPLGVAKDFFFIEWGMISSRFFFSEST